MSWIKGPAEGGTSCERHPIARHTSNYPAVINGNNLLCGRNSNGSRAGERLEAVSRSGAGRRRIVLKTCTVI